MKTIQYLKRHAYAIALGALLTYSFLLRVSYMHVFSFIPDSYRDYLVSYNIVAHHEWILVGPLNGAFGFLSSPAYNYLLSAVIWINSAPWLLRLGNVVAQVVAIGLLYYLGKEMFSKATGLAAACLLAFSKLALQESFAIFQPYLMQPLLIAAYTVLFLAYKRKNFLLLIGSIVLFLLAGAVHNSSYAVAPVFFFGIVLFFKERRARLMDGAILLLVAVNFIFVLYGPPLYYLLRHHQAAGSIVGTQLTLNPKMYTTHLAHIIGIIQNIHMVAFPDLTLSPHRTIFEAIIILILLGAALGYGLQPKRTEKKIQMAFLFLAIISPLLFAALLNSYLTARHFLLILPPLFLIIAELVQSIGNQQWYWRVSRGIGIIVIILYFMVSKTEFNLASAHNRATNSAETSAFAAMARYIVQTQTQEKYANVNFFRLYLYPDRPQENGYEDAEYWLGVQDALQSQFNLNDLNFVTNDDSALGLGYRTTNTDQYVLVICSQFIAGTDPKRCIEEFLLGHQNYSLQSNIFSTFPYTIYATKKSAD